MRIVLTALIVLTWSGAVLAQDAGALARADGNGDGRVTRSEFQALRALGFERLDANRDGALNAEERGAARGRMRGQLARADRNGDGVVTEAEFLNQPARAFDRFDANNDEALDGEELAALRAAMQRFGG